MYTATMQYQFKDDAFDQACEIWNREILEHAKSQAGFVRMQLLTARPRALAIGTWEDNQHARAFMETGAFKALMGKLQPNGHGAAAAGNLGSQVLRVDGMSLAKTGESPLFPAGSAKGLEHCVLDPDGRRD